MMIMVLKVIIRIQKVCEDICVQVCEAAILYKYDRKNDDLAKMTIYIT